MTETEIEKDVESFLAYKFAGITNDEFETLKQKYPLVHHFYQITEKDTYISLLIQPPTSGIDIFVLHGERASSIFSVNTDGKLYRNRTLLDFLTSFDKRQNEYNKRVIEAIEQLKVQMNQAAILY